MNTQISITRPFSLLWTLTNFNATSFSQDCSKHSHYLSQTFQVRHLPHKTVPSTLKRSRCDIFLTRLFQALSNVPGATSSSQLFQALSHVPGATSSSQECLGHHKCQLQYISYNCTLSAHITFTQDCPAHTLLTQDRPAHTLLTRLSHKTALHTRLSHKTALHSAHTTFSQDCPVHLSTSSQNFLTHISHKDKTVANTHTLQGNTFFSRTSHSPWFHKHPLLHPHLKTKPFSQKKHTIWFTQSNSILIAQSAKYKANHTQIFHTQTADWRCVWVTWTSCLFSADNVTQGPTGQHPPLSWTPRRHKRKWRECVGTTWPPGAAQGSSDKRPLVPSNHGLQGGGGGFLPFWLCVAVCVRAVAQGTCMSPQYVTTECVDEKNSVLII